MAKAVYTKQVVEREEMCSDCFRPGHFRKDCPGARNWKTYCEDFEDMWNLAMSENNSDGDDEEEVDSGETRLMKMNKEMKKQVNDLISQKEKAENELKKHIAQSQEEELKKKVDYYEKVLTEKRNYIYELEEKVRPHGNHISAEVEEQISHLVQENENLKRIIRITEEEKSDLEAKIKDGEDTVKSTLRRMSKSMNVEKDIGLNTTACNEMFDEEILNVSKINVEEDNTSAKDTVSYELTTEGENTHIVAEVNSGKGCDTTDGTSVIIGNTDGNVSTTITGGVKRSSSSPGTGNVSKKGILPEIGSKIKVKLGKKKGSEIFTVHYRSISKDKGDQNFCLIKKDGTLITLDLNKHKWEVVEVEDSTI